MTVLPGDIVQLDPGHYPDHLWSAQLLIVEEVKEWGVQGYTKTSEGLEYMQAETGTFEVVGRAAWLQVDP